MQHTPIVAAGLRDASTDVFQRLRQYALARRSLVEEDPSAFALLQEALSNPPAELQADLRAATAEIVAST